MDGCLPTPFASLPGSEAWRVVIWWAVAAAAAAVLVAVVLLVRRVLGVGKSAEPAAQKTFSIEQLERMRTEGSISEAEFKLLRSQALGLGDCGGPLHNASSSAGGNRDD